MEPIDEVCEIVLERCSPMRAARWVADELATCPGYRAECVIGEGAEARTEECALSRVTELIAHDESPDVTIFLDRLRTDFTDLAQPVIYILPDTGGVVLIEIVFSESAVGGQGALRRLAPALGQWALRLGQDLHAARVVIGHEPATDKDMQLFSREL